MTTTWSTAGLDRAPNTGITKSSVCEQNSGNREAHALPHHHPADVAPGRHQGHANLGNGALGNDIDATLQPDISASTRSPGCAFQEFPREHNRRARSCNPPVARVADKAAIDFRESSRLRRAA